MESQYAATNATETDQELRGCRGNQTRVSEPQTEQVFKLTTEASHLKRETESVFR